nr:EAL domain-containing protein [Zoogloeaceae bacterium]
MKAARPKTPGERSKSLTVRYIDGDKVLEAEQALRRIFDNTPAIAVQAYDADRRVVYWNRASEDLYGYAAAEAIGCRLEELIIPPELTEIVVAAHEAWLGGGPPIPAAELMLMHKNRSRVSVFSSHVMVARPSGEREMYCIDIDLSSLRRSEAELARLAHFDSLTNLPNRAMAQIRIEHALDRARRHDFGVAVLLLGIDRFKNVNESFGHPVGDELLVVLSTRFARRLRAGDTLARFGGDEFLVVLECLDEPAEAARVADALLRQLDEPFVLSGGQQLFVGMSIGISYFPDDSNDVTMLLQHADTALHQAKAAGRGTYRFFTAELTRAAQVRMELETRLRWAIEREEFELYYQPKVDLASQRVVGCEALIRWNDETCGLVGPDGFIPIAEETGLIVAIGEWALHAACEQLVDWHEAGHLELSVAVNLSARQMWQSSLPARVEDIIKRTGVRAASLELELTESMIMGQEETLAARMHELKALGVSLALDDFGTGYSSLSYLKRFPIDVLKIDRSFVRDIPGDNDSNEIAAAIIAMAHSLRLKVVAEGIETPEQVGFFRAHGCRLAQGYLFGHPMKADAFSRLLRP